MNQQLLQHLRTWRKKEAKRRGVEEYRILQNRSLEEIAEKKPTEKEAVLDIYGVAQKKYERYGDEIIEKITAFENGELTSEAEDREELNPDDPVPVSEFLDHVNRTLGSIHASVRGEITQIQKKYGNYYMTISDPEEESALDCIMKERHYDTAGIELEEGLEVVLTGSPNVYKKYGRFSLRATAVELVGEGALKKAYEKLKAKLSEEGLFEDAQKEEIPAFAQNIGLITSKGSDAYHDFAANLGQYGFSVKFYPSRVQGGRAVLELLSALKYFKESDVDVVVITRGGGGDLEVLQAFNNEKVVRAVTEMDAPVIAGIGHEQDVPLTSLAADRSVSTPTGSAEIINQSWQKLENFLHRCAQQIPAAYKDVFRKKEHQLQTDANDIQKQFRRLYERVGRLRERVRQSAKLVTHSLRAEKKTLERRRRQLFEKFQRSLTDKKEDLENIKQRLEDADPRRALERGYSIVTSESGVVRSVGDVSTGDEIDIRVRDGIINSQITGSQKDDE